MWFIYKTTPSDDKLHLVSTADNIYDCHDTHQSEGGHPAFFNGKQIIDCKRLARIGDALCEVKYECGARIYKVYGNLWVCMDPGGHQLKLGSFDECEDTLFGQIEDIARKSMCYKGQFEDCTYTAIWEEPKSNVEIWDEMAFIPKEKLRGVLCPHDNSKKELNHEKDHA